MIRLKGRCEKGTAEAPPPRLLTIKKGFGIILYKERKIVRKPSSSLLSLRCVLLLVLFFILTLAPQPKV